METFSAFVLYLLIFFGIPVLLFKIGFGEVGAVIGIFFGMYLLGRIIHDPDDPFQ